MGLYAISYQVCDQDCWPLTGEILNFTFDEWYDNYYVNFIYQEPFYYIITNQITSNGYWNTTEWFDGTYCLRINAYDIMSFYKKFVLGDTTKLNVAHYFLEDVELKNGISGNHNPVIDTGMHCKYPQEECGDCIKHNEQMTIELDAYDPDGDPLHYVWWCYYGYFIVGGNPVPACTTYENYVIYQAPDVWWNQDQLFVDVCDNRGGDTLASYHIEVFDPEYTCICGDVNDDLSVELGDIVYLINYVFRGGSPPYDPYERGDVNNDCEIELGDIVYLNNYVFQSGPPPECCWFPPAQ